MRKNLTKTAILTMCCLTASLAGCGGSSNNNATTTAGTTAQQTTTAVKETTTADTEPVTTTAESATTTTESATTATEPATTATVPTADDPEINAILPELTAGIIASNPAGIAAADTTGANIEIEKVETYGTSFVIVTLNAGCATVDADDISLIKYNTDWYKLSATSSPMKVTASYTTINSEGKTVIIYNTADTIKGTRVIADTSAKKFDNLEAEIKKADNYLSWQMDNGGWDKGVDKQAVSTWTEGMKKNQSSGWTGQGGVLIGTIDNDATYTQMQHIAAVYREVPDEKYKESVLKGLDFIFNLQYESGGFAQVYPRRGNYSDHVTFNDNAMINVLIMLEKMRDRSYPFDSDIIPDEYITKIDESINKAVDFILKAQIESNGRLTAWCAQHDPVTYAPRGARAYELPSISGSESVAIIKFLMNQKQTPEIKNAVESAIQWFKDSEVKNMKYIKNDPNGVYFVESEGSSLWYRFYDIETNLPIFCDRDGIKKHSITEIGEERRNGYSWSGNYPQKLLKVYDESGYYAGRIEAVVTKTNSVTKDGKKLVKDAVREVDSQILFVD